MSIQPTEGQRLRAYRGAAALPPLRPADEPTLAQVAAELRECDRVERIIEAQERRQRVNRMSLHTPRTSGPWGHPTQRKLPAPRARWVLTAIAAGAAIAWWPTTRSLELLLDAIL